MTTVESLLLLPPALYTAADVFSAAGVPNISDVPLLLTMLKLLVFLLLLPTSKGPKLEISAPGVLHNSDLFGWVT